MAAAKKAAKVKTFDFETTMEKALMIAEALGWLSSQKIKNGKAALRIGRMFDKFTPEVKRYEERRMELVKKLGKQKETENEDGEIEFGDWSVLPENNDEWEKEFNTIKDEPVKIVGIVKIDFANIQNVGTPPRYLSSLDPVMTGQDD